MWFWGTWPLLQQRSLLVKLHRLSVADTLGSALMLAGLWLQRADLWPLLLLALIGLMLWNTIFGYVLASTSQNPRSR
jgi:multicomponent Na+:H+ antiporter subunit G